VVPPSRRAEAGRNVCCAASSAACGSPSIPRQMPSTSVACASKSSARSFAGRSGFERPAETAAELVVATASVVITLVVIALAVVLFVSLRQREGLTGEGHLHRDLVTGGKSPTL